MYGVSVGIDFVQKQCKLVNSPPICPICGLIARPNILMFGDWNWQQEREHEQRQREVKRLEKVIHNLWNVNRGWYRYSTSRKYGARIIRINPREFDVPSKLDVGTPTGSLEALLAIDDSLNAWPQEIDLNFMGIA